MGDSDGYVRHMGGGGETDSPFSVLSFSPKLTPGAAIAVEEVAMRQEWGEEWG